MSDGGPPVTDKQEKKKVWEETWEADIAILVCNKEDIAVLEDSSPNSDLDVARCQLAAQAPAMARLLKRLLEEGLVGLADRQAQYQIMKTLRDAGVLG